MAYVGNKVLLPIGRLGFVATANMSRVPIEGAIAMEGVIVESGAVQREFGSVKYNASAIANSIFNTGIEYYPTSGTKRFVAAVFTTVPDWSLLKDDGTGAFAVTLKTGIGDSSIRPHSFCVGGAESGGRAKKLFFFHTTIPVQVLSGDGVVTANIAGPPADWTGTSHPAFGFIHRNRLMAGPSRVNDPHRLYVSLATDHESLLATPFSFSIFPGEGDYLSGGISSSGRAFIFKYPRGIYWLDDASTNTADWGIKKLTDAVGLLNPNCIVQGEEDVYFVGADMLPYSLSTVAAAIGDVKPRSLLSEFDLDRWLLSVVDKSSSNAVINLSKLLWHPIERSLIFTTQRAAVATSMKIQFDMKDEPRKVYYSFRDDNRLSSIVTGPAGVKQHVFGSAVGGSGQLYRGDQVVRSAVSANAGAGGVWPSKYQVPHTDFSFADEELRDIRKKLEWLTVESTMFFEQTIFCDVYLDGTFKYTLEFKFPIDIGFVLDVSLLDVDLLGGAAVYKRTKRLRGTCDRASFLFYTNDAIANIILGDVTVWFKGGSHRLRRVP